MRYLYIVLSIVAAFAVSGHAGAQETRFAVTLGGTYTDNVERVSVAEESELMLEAGLQFAIAREGRLDTDLAANLRYRTYTDDAFDDELVGGLDGIVSYAFVPDRFEWVIENNFGQSYIDPRDVETPDNRQNFNYFSTGPTITLALGTRTDLSISGLWSNFEFEESDFDSERVGAEVQLARAMSNESSLSLNLSAERIEFDESPPNSDYDLQTASVSYQTRGVRTTLALTGGVTVLHDFGETSDGPLLDLTLTRELGARSLLTLNVGTIYFDAAESVRRDRGFEEIVPGNQDVVPAQDAFQQDFAFVGWEYEGTRSTLQLSVDWQNESRDVATEFDRETTGAALGLTRRIGPRTAATLFGRYARDNFDSSSVEFDEWSAGVGLDWNLSESIAIGLRAEHFDGNGDTTGGDDARDYAENRFSVTLMYSPRR